MEKTVSIPTHWFGYQTIYDGQHYNSMCSDVHVLHNIAVEANDIFEIDDTVDYGAHCTQSSDSTIANTTGTSDGLVLQNN